MLGKHLLFISTRLSWGDKSIHLNKLPCNVYLESIFTYLCLPGSTLKFERNLGGLCVQPTARRETRKQFKSVKNYTHVLLLTATCLRTLAPTSHPTNSRGGRSTWNKATPSRASPSRCPVSIDTVCSAICFACFFFSVYLFVLIQNCPLNFLKM